MHSEIARAVTSQDATITAADAKLVLDWCIVASHHDNKGDSLLALNVGAAISGDPSFGKWTFDHLEATLGHEGTAMPAATTMQPDSLAVLALVAAQVEKSVAEALKPANGATTTTNTAP